MTTVEETQVEVSAIERSKRQRASVTLLHGRRLRNALRLLLLYVLAGLVALVCLMPIVWMVKTSFETPEFIRSAQVQFWPIRFTFDNYRSVLTNPHAMIWRSMLNSLIVASAATLLNLVITASAGYAMSRFEFRGKLVFGMYLLVVYMIPRTLMLIGLFVMLAKLRLINKLMGLIVVYAAGGITLSIWWLKGYFDSIPIELEEQAMIDGCSRVNALRRIILPLALPAVAAVGLFQFVDCWNEYMMALTIIQSANLRLLPVQITFFMGIQRVEWGPVMAFSVIVAVPAIILFSFTQRNMVSGLMAGFSK
ncbi:MAG: ABC transporter permease subunit [Anaerolineae bacterium]|nr:ABC transporter permease subunit [Anaerolineae bacterium]